MSKFTTAGTPLSPATGTNAAGGSYLGFAHAGISSALGVGVDQSGNVWLANNNTSTATKDPTSIFEVVGAASPTYNPLSLQLKNSKVGVRP